MEQILNPFFHFLSVSVQNFFNVFMLRNISIIDYQNLITVPSVFQGRISLLFNVLTL